MRGDRLPPGVVNIICGKGAEVGDALASSTVPTLLTLIGSPRTGRRISEKGTSSIKRFSMELGGNAPVLVFPDADLELAAEVASSSN
jgi:succinate-semialdehyde dehydrogenase/glutarate-semialdehyde dehydrogenase